MCDAGFLPLSIVRYIQALKVGKKAGLEGHQGSAVSDLRLTDSPDIERR